MWDLYIPPLLEDQRPRWHIGRRLALIPSVTAQCNRTMILSALTAGTPSGATFHSFKTRHGSEMILVIENASKGYLADFLVNLNDERRILSWEKRLKVCIDVARALSYLHYEMEDQKMIINRDIRSDQIGLDENWGAKIYDFAGSIFLPLDLEEEALYLDRVVGSRDYLDPEYLVTGQLKRESDVYSFGVVLLEILCGRLTYDPIFHKESDNGLARMARRSFNTQELENMIDPKIKEEIGEDNFILSRGPNKKSLHTFIGIAYKCVAETQNERPTMKVVLNELEKALFFQNKGSPRISLEDIKLATQNFRDDNCIGEGRFKKVYRGHLQHGDGFITTVLKRMDTRLGQGKQQFLNEVQILMEYKHENIISLLGYCDEKDEKIIVYEYASKGSLNLYLNNACLTWKKRLSICIDVASALDFLHGGVGRHAKVIIHGDVKTSNILLNSDWKAKLDGFELALISPLNQKTNNVIDHVRRILGYLDPEDNKSNFITNESDTYSFGVVLFEILCGRSLLAICRHEGHLPDFIRNNFGEGKHDDFVFEQIKEEIVPQSLSIFKKIAYKCIHPEREKRPKMKEVLMQLKKSLDFQILVNRMKKCRHGWVETREREWVVAGEGGDCCGVLVEVVVMQDWRWWLRR
ncbi:hypothetical protein QVD17_34706 [Tagetes erecta]|uniref:Protein kinase domain-containing protein n=1 Tax=Tagetes erecta TaxID=13708 RepID=A0AAD8K0W6_TARER|nr:hypothetical protein QVD17_34706 [Tagetes erecta]